jgi:hypothetical protein
MILVYPFFLIASHLIYLHVLYVIFTEIIGPFFYGTEESANSFTQVRFNFTILTIKIHTQLGSSVGKAICYGLDG